MTRGRGRPLNPVDPSASATAALGAEIRRLRVERGWTLEVFGSKIGYTAQHISASEQAKGSFSKHFITTCDRTLGADGDLLARLPDVVVERVFARDDRSNARSLAGTLEDDVRRKAFLGLGLVAVVLGPEAAARTLSEIEGDEIAADWTREVAFSQDRPALARGLRADLKRLAEQGGPQRTIAALSSCAAMVALSSGDNDAARRYWSRAHVAARASGDRRLAAYVAGQHAYDGVYALYTPAQALTLADRAIAITHSPCTGRMHALGSRARALALMGRKREAREAMRDLELAFERLPRSVTKRPIGGWDELRLHHTASFVAAFGGVGSARTHDDAAKCSHIWRATTQIELHRAAAEADAAHALRALTGPARGDRFIRRLGARTLAVIEAQGADVGELREALA
jgi:transcriptional regulator with XRE-family HTH domain